MSARRTPRGRSRDAPLDRSAQGPGGTETFRLALSALRDPAPTLSAGFGVPTHWIPGRLGAGRIEPAL